MSEPDASPIPEPDTPGPLTPEPDTSPEPVDNAEEPGQPGESANAARLHGLFEQRLHDELVAILDRLDRAGL